MRYTTHMSGQRNKGQNKSHENPNNQNKNRNTSTVNPESTRQNVGEREDSNPKPEYMFNMYHT